MHEQLGREHARAYFTQPRTFDTIGPRSAEYANAALEELEQLQLGAPGMIEALLDGGNHGARQLNADSFQGLREIVQNADDLGATAVRFGTRTIDDRHQLLIVHNGAPVELMHVLPMIYPFLSTKRRDAHLKGRFGVGLKTLSRLGRELTVHSVPFHFASRENLAVRIAPVAAIADFYDPAAGETLFTLDLDDEVEEDFLIDWFDTWFANDLLFLDTVREITIHDLDTGGRSVVALAEVGDPSTFSLPFEDTHVLAERRIFEIEGRRWERYVAQVGVPEGKHRTDKATGATTPVGVAIPIDGDFVGRIHVALPTRISTGGAFSIDAQFDPATSREELIGDPWNRWLIKASSEVLGSLAIHLAHMGSPLAWSVVPVGAATNSTSTWVNDRFRTAWEKTIEDFATDGSLIGGQPGCGLADVAYCDEETEGMLDIDDHEVVAGAQMVPTEIRDKRGRWREVLDAIGVSKKINLTNVVECCEDDRFDGKSAKWFLELAAKCIEFDSENLLLGARWVPLEDGGRVFARVQHEADELLVTEVPDNELAIRHLLCRTVHPLLSEERYSEVRSWLTRIANLVLELQAPELLRAFARRYAEKPCEATREDLLAIRDLFAEVVEREPGELGRSVGRALLIEAFRYDTEESGVVRSTMRARPDQVYLPASIEDEPDGWSRAAGETPGLLWASPAYAEVLKLERRRKLDRGRGKLRAAKRFFVLLGAATIPRLERVDTPITYALPLLQAPARYKIGRASGFLEDDYVSPDLDLVIEDLQAKSQGSARRQGSRRSDRIKDRGIALFRCLASNWSAIEDASTTWAIRDSRRGGYLVDLPATWLARLADEPWLVNEAGGVSRPRGLAIATKVTSAIYDDPAMFAAGLTAADATSPLARALVMNVDPPASALVHAIEQLRDESNVSDGGDILRLYRALAGHCPHGSGTPSPEAAVGDLTVGSLRAKFGISRSRRGLIAGHATTSGRQDWFAPTTVYSGKDIFHGRQPFVIADRDLLPLWNALNIAAPDVSDCVRELKQIAREPAWPERDAVLIDIYRHVDRLLEKASAADRRALIDLPLFCNGQWVTDRPIYISEYSGLSVPGARLWSPPCAIGTMRNFVAALGLERLPVDDHPLSQAYELDENLQNRFEAALRILQADLARDDERSYRAMEPWSRLAHLRLHVHPPGGLTVRAVPARGKAMALMVRAHTHVTNPAIHVDSEEVIGRVEFGGQAVAQFADARHRRDVALAWVSAWSTSADELSSAAIELAGEEVEGNLDQLAAQFDRLKKSGGRRKMPTARGRGNNEAGEEAPKAEVRRLKDIPSDFEFKLVLRDDEEDARKGAQHRKRLDLKDAADKQDTNKPSNEGAQPAPVTAHRQYDSRQLQVRGWEYVRMALEDAQKEGQITLADLQSERGIGADGIIDWETFVEMKCFAREMPAEVTLTEAEFLRAKERKEKFLLVVVSGLEEGFRTEVRVYSDPLATLPWTPKGSVSVSGLRSGRVLILSEEKTVRRTGGDLTKRA
ncbi:sacsin N-terminal ATP-binding-like domain-containing protein [Sinorhizobium fredii]|uniref:sacsin N-terminal ATP-binding-like domain-containing protein n=1 Tax=Rhizobium fredii TaxID=380 RepID=UPI0004B1A5FD|nr:hypothetical protein [Sinorhizobium fredii]